MMVIIFFMINIPQTELRLSHPAVYPPPCYSHTYERRKNQLRKMKLKTIPETTEQKNEEALNPQFRIMKK